jgi:hypothetical protein
MRLCDKYVDKHKSSHGESTRFYCGVGGVYNASRGKMFIKIICENTHIHTNSFLLSSNINS